MMYTAMKNTLRQEVTFPRLDTGVDTRPFSREMGEYTLDVGENVWWEQESLRTRPSLCLKNRLDRHAVTPTSPGELEETFSAAWWTETYIRDNVQYIRAFRLDEEGQCIATVEPLAAAYAVIMAWGDGWLAIADTGLFRLEPGTDAWVSCEEDIYVPTVMINGRGCLPAEMRSVDGEAYEEYNRLTDRFAATYTTDGTSPRFYLPQTGLGNDTVTAVLLDAEGRSLTYRAAAGASLSDTVDGRIMRVDRTGGYISFQDAGGADAPPPAAGRENNLTVTASKQGIGGGEVIRGMRRGQWLKSDEYRSVLMLTGKEEDPSLICWFQPDDCLYIPQSHCTHIGDEHSGVTAIVSVRERLLLFKPRGMYLMTASNTEGAERRRFSVSLYPSGTGCTAPDTIQVGEDQVVWLDTEGRVRLTFDQVTGRKAPDRLSGPIADELQKQTSAARRNASAVWWQGRYLLRFDRDIWVLTPDPDRPVWFHWTLDEGLSPGPWAAPGDRVELLCRAVENGRPIWAVYHLTADNTGQDQLWIDDAVTGVAIPYRVTTKLWDGELPEQRYRLDALRVEGELPGQAVTVTLRTEGGTADTLRWTGDQMRGQRIPLRLARFRWLGLTLAGKGFLCWRRLRLYRQLYQGGQR